MKNFIEKIVIGTKNSTIIQATLIGLLSGILITIFKITITYMLQVIKHYTFDGSNELYLLPVITTIGAIISGYLVYKFAPEAKGSGIPYVKATLLKFGNLTRIRSIFVKFFGGIAAIGTGMSLGREGPSVQLGAGVGALIGKIFKVSGTNQNKLISAGAGSTIAATFNAPIAGSIFVLEELMQGFSSNILFPTIIATFCASTISRYILGNKTIFDVPTITNTNINFISCIILGLIAGVLGVIWSKLIHTNNHLFTKINIPPYLKTAIAGIIVGIIGMYLPLILGSGDYGTELLLQHKIPIIIVAIMFVAKFFITPICFASGTVGGIFLPMLMIGAFLGYLTGTILNIIGIESNTILMSLIGMSAFLSSVAKTPITASIMVFEMTGEYNIILPILLTSAISDLVATKLKHKPIYSELIVNQTKNTPEANKLSSILVENILNKDIKTFDENTNVEDILKEPNTIFCITNKNNKLIGTINKSDIQDLLINYSMKNRNVLAKHVMTPNPITATINDDLYIILFRLHCYNISEIIIISKDKKPIGTINKEMIYNILNN